MAKTEREPVYIIAEAGINHGGDMDVAAEMVRVAAQAGVSAVKFQSISAAGLTHAVLAADQHEFFSRFEMGRREHEQLAALTRESGLDFLSTPFAFKLADMLAGIGVPAFKISSSDLTNLPLIAHCAAFGKPLYISTGMGNIAEARQAYDTAREAGSPRVVMLQCTTNYPTAHENVNLRAMAHLASELGCQVGFSDHSIGNWACFGAVALGAVVVEKHFCLDKSMEGPDIPGSCDPAELADLARGIRALELALGEGGKAMRESEREMAQVARRSIYYSSHLDLGHVLCAADLSFLRPAGGMSPAQASELIGKALRCDVSAGDAAAPEDVG
jgi:N,N'-diacetyllegionaminate synthase